jgi:hypothetical protein
MRRRFSFPWGWTQTPAPNRQALQTLARKFGFYTGYPACQSGADGCIYMTDGTTDDFAYGELGVAAYTFELGTSFFPGVLHFWDGDHHADAGKPDLRGEGGRTALPGPGRARGDQPGALG